MIYTGVRPGRIYDTRSFNGRRRRPYNPTVRSSTMFDACVSL